MKMYDATEKWRCYRDFYQHSSYSIFEQEHRTTPGRLPFHMIKVDQFDHHLSDPVVPELILALPLRADRYTEWSWDMGEGWIHQSAAPGKMMLMPPNCASRWHVKGSRQLLVLTVDIRTVCDILGLYTFDRLNEVLHPLTEKTWGDALASQLMLRMWQASHTQCTTDRMLADSALVTLITHLVGRVTELLRPSRLVALPAWRMRRVCDYVDAHLHEPLDVCALATAAGLSVRHFARVFRLETGATPHRWLMERRLACATNLLKQNQLPLAQIAQICGFAGQSHFCKYFRQLTGETPTRWMHQNLGEKIDT